mmetsp:Transcript_3112/g.7729  ORF Transcript_3112/g.7729 Transcript_3112/m.7729 type:complete len:240 (-) Transcript_3112:1348-2067(-)
MRSLTATKLWVRGVLSPPLRPTLPGEERNCILGGEMDAPRKDTTLGCRILLRAATSRPNSFSRLCFSSALEASDSWRITLTATWVLSHLPRYVLPVAPRPTSASSWIWSSGMCHSFCSTCFSRSCKFCVMASLTVKWSLCLKVRCSSSLMETEPSCRYLTAAIFRSCASCLCTFSRLPIHLLINWNHSSGLMLASAVSVSFCERLMLLIILVTAFGTCDLACSRASACSGVASSMNAFA